MKMNERTLVKLLNDHLPRARHTVSGLLAADEPSLQTSDGRILSIDRERLNELASLIPTQYHSQVRLPIVLIKTIDQQRSFFSVAGNAPDRLLVTGALNPQQTALDAQSGEVGLSLSRQQAVKLIEQYHPLVAVGFATSKTDPEVI